MLIRVRIYFSQMDLAQEDQASLRLDTQKAQGSPLQMPEAQVDQQFLIRTEVLTISGQVDVTLDR